MRDEVYWVWLQQALGAGAAQGERLLAVYGGAEAVYKANVFDASCELTAAQQRHLQNKDLSGALTTVETVEKRGAWILTPQNEVYAALFGGMYAPPMVLYGKGECFDPSDAPTVAVVGTRFCDESGILVTRRLAAGLAAGGAILISGGAEGLDSEALRAALDEGGRCISFQACGIDVEYPQAVTPLRQRLLAGGGMLLSEFPLGAPALRHHFRIRNRLISAAARGTLVTQAPLRSGALMTANWAREQGRDVFAAPGAVGVVPSEGSNELLKDGAKPVTNAADILMEYIDRYPHVIRIDEAAKAEERAAQKRRQELRGAASNTPIPVPVKPVAKPLTTKVAEVAEVPPQVMPCPAAVTPDAKTVYEALTAGAKTASEIAKMIGMPLNRVLSAVTVLELYGTVDCEVGQRYALRTKS